MNILVLAAGEGSAALHAGYPLWLAEAGGQTVLEHVVRAFSNLEPSRFIFAFRQADIRAFHLTDLVALLTPSCSVVEVARETQGAACTALLAIGEIDQQAELVIVSATDLVDVDMVEVVRSFKDRGAAAGVVTFAALHPRYAYFRCNEDGDVVEAAEKRPISRNAGTGLFWFAQAVDFFDAVRTMIIKDAKVNDRFFISPSINELILRQKRVSSFPIDPARYHPVKGSTDLDSLEHALTTGDTDAA